MLFLFAVASMLLTRISFSFPLSSYSQSIETKNQRKSFAAILAGQG
jgi:hypothetical protein